MSATEFTRVGFGQVEPNHLSAQRTGRIWAQLPTKSVAKDATNGVDILENGQFVKYDAENGCVDVDATSDYPWVMVWNEVKLYKDGRDREGYKDWAMQRKNYLEGPTAVNADTYHASEADLGEMLENAYGHVPFPGQMYPRVIAIDLGDIWTTNTIEVPNDNANTEVTTTNTYGLGSTLYVGAKGYLTSAKPASYDGPEFKVIKDYTMPDLQRGLKVMRVK